ncbi:hypothetical protein M885DRAFT_33558 [Pelagophyceae sp. CCMP2097]|nr:hypothetical protein M885DRAFT_33558 [Pelagophyceae sp. CCMP2097]
MCIPTPRLLSRIARNTPQPPRAAAKEPLDPVPSHRPLPLGSCPRSAAAKARGERRRPGALERRSPGRRASSCRRSRELSRVVSRRGG